MKNHSRVWHSNLMLLVLLACGPLAAQDAELARPAPDKVEDPFAVARRDAERVVVRLNDKKLELQPGPLYTYKEVIRQWNKGTTWVWGSQGRPAVLLNLSTHGARRYYEFISLAAAQLDVDTSLGDRWIPRPDWKPRLIEKAPAPDSDRRKRLIQLRALARRFSAYEKDYWENGRRHDLRLLPQPIFRYAVESEESLDGAIFAFNRDNDLEAILVIDALKHKIGRPEWMFDCQRVAAHEVVVELDGTEVWRREAIQIDGTTPQSAYRILYRATRDEER